MTSEIALDSARIQIKWKEILNSFISLVLILGVAFLVVSPLFFTETLDAHDIYYHFDAIRSLNQAWQNGTFTNRIYSLLAQDYGYGTGLFYSMLPAGLCVIFMNVFNLSCSHALILEFFLIFSLAGVTVYFFLKRIFKRNFIATMCALIYTAFPYFLADVYVRFAFSEIFLILAIPLMFWGLYELLERNNYKAFLFLFTTGVTLGIFTHFTMTVIACIFALIYICLNYKKFISNYRWVPFLVSCALVVLITATFTIPMLFNYGGTDASDMGNGSGYVYVTTTQMFSNDYLISSNLIMIVVYIVFLAVHLNRNKEERKSARNFFIMSSIIVWTVTPFFPWVILYFAPFTTMQFAWRILLLVALTVSFMVGYILIYLDKKVLRCGFLIGLCIIIPIGDAWQIKDHINSGVINLNTTISTNSFLSNNEGLGAAKNGDYLPIGATNEYIFSRANESLLIDANVTVSELANYQSLNQLSFLIEAEGSGYVVLKIPFEVCNNLEILQIQTNNESEKDISSSISAENEGGVDYLRIDFADANGNFKIIINYPDDGDFDKYLIENPFEFIVLSGGASFNNFVKTGTDYTVEITLTSSEDTRIELPTLYYEGYTLTYTTQNGSYTLDATHGENGFIEIVVGESGTLTVEFTAGYITFSNIVSILGAVMFAIVLLAVMLIPRKYFARLGNWVTSMFKKYKILGEIVRFGIVGVIATLVDMFTMGVVMFAMQHEIYSSFINVFINTPTPSTFATIIGTTVGFIVGLLVNYVLSIFFVFNEKGNSKTAKGFMVFVFLSTIGLMINILGTFIGFNLMGLNQWFVKIIMVVIVLVYNYISKRLILFRKKSEKLGADESNFAKINENSIKQDIKNSFINTLIDSKKNEKLKSKTDENDVINDDKSNKKEE